MDPSDRAAWSRVLDDYEIMQPFAQIRRDAPTLDAKEMSTSTTQHFASGEPVHGARFFALHRAGWTASWQGLMKEIGDYKAKLEVKPGIESFMSKPEDQTLGALTIVGCTFGELSRIARWELLREVAQVMSKHTD